jgi:hypothetical protein
MLVVVAVTMLVVGVHLAASLPKAVRQRDGSVLARMLGPMKLLGGAGGLLALGGAIIAALVGAAPVAIWLGKAFFVGAGLVALSTLALVALAIWHPLAQTGS